MNVLFTVKPCSNLWTLLHFCTTFVFLWNLYFSLLPTFILTPFIVQIATCSTFLSGFWHFRCSINFPSSWRCDHIWTGCPLFLCILLILGLPVTSILGLLFASVCWISCFPDLISSCVLLCQNVFSSSCLRKINGSLIFNHLWDLEWLNMSYFVLTLNCLFGWL